MARGKRRRLRLPRSTRRLLSKLPRWSRWLLVALAPLVALNLAVAFFGSSVVFPLSPFFVRDKLCALGQYAWHRPHCLLGGHGSMDAEVARAEGKHRLPRGLLAALIEVESNGRVHRISSAGAMGPAQLVPSTARLLGVSDPFDPVQAVDGAGRYLAMQLSAFRDVRLAVAAYNAGPGAITNRQVPRNGETETYVRKVMRSYASRRPSRVASR